MILAHTDALHLSRLIAALGGEHAIFVHIDKKVVIGPFLGAACDRPNVEFIEDRTVVTWGGFSVVRATLSLMRRALESLEPFDYAVLLSGLDYPIKSGRYIAEYFGRHPGREFLRYANILEHAFLMSKIDRMYFQDNRLYRLVNRGVASVVGARVRDAIQANALKKPPLPEGMVPYFGPQWWALTQDCVRYVLRFVDTHLSFVNFYSSTSIPDEMFFHTIIMNSPFGTKTNTREEYSQWPSGHLAREAGDFIKYSDWSLSRERPAILDERDFPALERSRCLFARKFHSITSRKLIERIDKELLQVGCTDEAVPESAPEGQIPPLRDLRRPV